jgi:hypothetical protein
MSDHERDDDLPGGDETFDIDIEGFDDLNFRETEANASKSEALDLELDRLLKRLDKVVAEDPVEDPVEDPAQEDPLEVPRSFDPPVPKSVPRAPAPARPVPGGDRAGALEPDESLAPHGSPKARLKGQSDHLAEPSTILLTERLSEEDPDFDRPNPSPKASPKAATLAATTTTTATTATTVAELSPGELADLIERAVERGVRRALAARRANQT